MSYVLHTIFPFLHDWATRAHRSVAPGPRPWVGTVSTCRKCGRVKGVELT